MNYSINVTQDCSVDNRLNPRQRKHPLLWQTYLFWNELVEMRKSHTLRLKSCEAGKSSMVGEYEQYVIDRFDLDKHIAPKNKAEKNGSVYIEMVEQGEKVGPIWHWLISHKGIGQSLAAQLLAQIDDIERFDTISKLWRFAGYGIFEYWVNGKGEVICPREGWKWIEIKGNKYRVWTVIDQRGNETHFVDVDIDEAHKYAIPQNISLPLIERVDYLEPKEDWQLKKMSDRLCKDYHSPFNRKLKSIMFLVMDSFVKQQTPFYVDMYYSEKERLRALHPERIKVNGKVKYNDGHIDNMAKRKVKKRFLKNLWLQWREFEGLPISEEWKGYLWLVT